MMVCVRIPAHHCNELLFLGEDAFLLEGALLGKFIIFSMLGILMTTKDTDDRPMVEQLPAGGETVNKDISRQRRKIIKASAVAVPTIVTLCNGAAAAATSALGCIDRDKNALPADSVVVEQDTWVRKIAVYKTDLKITTSTDDDGDPDAWGSKGSYLIVDGNYYLDNAGSYTLVNSGGEKVYEKPLNPNTKVTDTEVYVLCYIEFDESGNIVSRTYYPDRAGDGEFQVTTSCLCSVNPNYSG